MSEDIQRTFRQCCLLQGTRLNKLGAYSFPIVFFLTEERLCEPKLTRRETSWHSPRVRYHKRILDYGSHVVDYGFYAAESGFHADTGFQSWVFLGVAKAILSSLLFCGVGIVRLLTSLMWWLRRPKHQETKDSLSVKPGFQIPNFSEIPNSLSWILNSKALDSGSHQQNFTWVDFHNMAMQLSSWYPLQYSVVPLQKSRPETRHDTLAASIAFFGSVILGNAYIAPATSLHLTFSTDSRTFVVIFAFLL